MSINKNNKVGLCHFLHLVLYHLLGSSQPLHTELIVNALTDVESHKKLVGILCSRCRANKKRVSTLYKCKAAKAVKVIQYAVRALFPEALE